MADDRLRPRVKAVVDEIWTQTAQRWSLERAGSGVRSVMIEVTELAQSPRMGWSADATVADMLRRRFRRHEKFSWIDGAGIAVLGVLHYRMGLASRLEDQE